MKAQPQQEEALIAFNDLKDLYADKIDELSYLKRLVFQ